MATLGKYRLILTLGRGGMADVYLGAADSSIAAGFIKLVVIKRLRDAHDESLSAMFLDEARLAARLNHPNVVQTNEVGEADGSLFMAMEFLEGHSFHEVWRRERDRGNRVPRDLMIHALTEALSGLHYSHELKDYDGSPLRIVHRDFTPNNLFMTYEGQIKVLDFGVAKMAHRSVQTDTGVIKGKLRFMAPEQALGLNVDRRCDVFAAGLILWELVAGRRFWGQMSDVEIFGSLIRGEYLPSVEIDGAPPALNTTLKRALARNAADRHDTALALRQDLDAFLRAAGQLDGARERLATYLHELFADVRANTSKFVKKRLASLNDSSSDQQPVSVPGSHDSGPSDSPIARSTHAPVARAAHSTDVQSTQNQPSTTGSLSERPETMAARPDHAGKRPKGVLAIACAIAGIATAGIVLATASSRSRVSASSRPALDSSVTSAPSAVPADSSSAPAPVSVLSAASVAATRATAATVFTPTIQRTPPRVPTATSPRGSAPPATPARPPEAVPPGRQRKPIDKDYVVDP